MLFKVGELAKRCGLTVRALHHYDSIGLLKPSVRSAAGYRLYTRTDVARLHQIQALRGLGVALADIGAILNRQDLPLSSLIEQQLCQLDRQIAERTRLRERLARLQAQCLAGEEPELADWLETLEMMSMYDKYFSQEELAKLPFYQSQNAGQWPGLAAEAATLMRTGVSSQSDEAQALARRWMMQLEQDTGGDPRLLAKLDSMHSAEPGMRQQTQVSQAVANFVLAAFAESKLAIYQRYLTAEEFAFMRAHYADSMREWPGLLAQLKQCQDDGIAADAPPMRALAERWLELFRGYAGDDPATQQKIRQANAQEPALMEGSWVDPELLAYLGEAVNALQTA